MSSPMPTIVCSEAEIRRPAILHCSSGLAIGAEIRTIEAGGIFAPTHRPDDHRDPPRASARGLRPSAGGVAPNAGQGTVRAGRGVLRRRLRRRACHTAHAVGGSEDPPYTRALYTSPTVAQPFR